MKAIFFEKHGHIGVLKYADLPTPVPGPGEALIRVRAVALNHLDIWVREGWKGLSLPMPHITGCDIVGEIVSVNPGDSQWVVGTRVAINPGIVTYEDEFTRRGEDSLSPGYKILGEQLRGGLAEFAVVPVSNVFQAPAHLKDAEIAGTLLVGTTCWRMLFKRANLTPGQSILVVGAGGGVNSFTIKLARSIGCPVYVLAGGKEKVKQAEALGATEVIDYSKISNWPIEVLKITKGRGVDVVVDNVGQSTIEKSIRSAARGGCVVTVGNTSGFEVTFDNRLLFTKQVSIMGSTMGSRQDFIDAMQFYWKNSITAPIDCVAPLSDGIKMMKRLEDGSQFGKIVLSPE